MLIKFVRIKIFCVSFVLFSVFFVGLSARSEAAKKYHVSAKSAIFSNSTKVRRLYGKNVHKKVLPASTVKVMTALLALEKLPLNHMVKVSKNATYPEPSKIYARPGDRYKVSDLLFAILLRSANDASVILAEAMAGTEKKFTVMMNKRAKQLGCQHTQFANSNGLPTKPGTQYTTAYDMYLIFRAALKHPFFKKAITYKYKTIYSEKGRKTTLKSHNKILFLIGNKSFLERRDIQKRQNHVLSDTQNMGEMI